MNDHSFHLAEIIRPETPYLIMQSSVKDKKASKGVFVIQCPEVEAVKLVRGGATYRGAATSATSGSRTSRSRDCTR